ncbi:MAG: SIS domain-containing protein [Spirochaetes bacterium]|nr:SIS domain-containing protein [Spirochaetota bacterium]
MLELDGKLLAKNKETEILSSYMAADRIERTLADNEALAADLAAYIAAYKPDRIIFVGSGASWCTLYSGWYFMRTSSTLPVMHFFGPELIADDSPVLRTGKTLAIVASYSGKTADTLAASEFLAKAGIPRIALSKDEKGPLAAGCERILPYRDKCLYTSAMTSLLSMLCSYLVLRGETEPAGELRSALERIPGQMRGIISRAEERAQADLELLKDDDFFYVTGDGALWALAYQYGYTNLMEYSRVHAACLRSSEWRHGPLEIMFRKPAMIHFIGNDRTRAYSEATRDYCKANGGRLAVFDVKDYYETHPVLAPMVLHPVSQFFFMYQSTLRGIDMDNYLEMHVKPYKPGETYF